MVSVKIGGRRLKVALFRRNVNKTLLHIPHSHLSFFHIRDSRCLYIIIYIHIYIYIYINLKLRLRLPSLQLLGFRGRISANSILEVGISYIDGQARYQFNGRPRQVMQLSQLCINCFDLFVVVFLVAHRILQILSYKITSHQNHLIILSYHITSYPISHLNMFIIKLTISSPNTSHHITSYHIRIILCHFLPYHTISYHIRNKSILSFHIIP